MARKKTEYNGRIKFTHVYKLTLYAEQFEQESVKLISGVSGTALVWLALEQAGKRVSYEEPQVEDLME